MDMSRDRNLLFGILAVQLKGVTAAQVMEAAAAWSTDPSICLAQRLQDLGAMSQRDRELLEGLVEEAVRMHGGNEEEALRSFGGEEQATRTLSGEFGSAELDAMNTAPMTSFAYFSGSGAEVSGVEETPGRYTLISQHARGGMGRVLLMHDEYLGRNIALKELMPVSPESGTGDRQSPMRQTASLIARFLQEARVTGQLEHPAIVPVYELGRRQDGKLYYTMKLVRGQTLLQALRDCTSVQDRMRLLPNFIDLCQAIAYAHSRGVIHRDIKPANVMVGQFGETVVLDWGLAKVRDTEDVNIEDIENTLHFLELEEEETLPKTAYGRALGTPHYMPPEQAEGRIDAIDERSDVYSLGAVLYEILTGTTPYTGRGTREILDKVINSTPVPVLNSAPDVPPPLAMLCEKALQKEPERRYQTAGGLAEEVQRFVAGSLVRAYRYSLREIFSHYYRRYRGLINVSVASLLLLIGMGVFSYISIMQARDREHEQRLAAEEAQRNEAVARSAAERAGYITQLQLIQAFTDSQSQGMANEVAAKTLPTQRGWEWGFLVNRANPALRTVLTPGTRIDSATISPDGSLIATSSQGGPVQVWDLATGALKTTCEGEGLIISEVCSFSPDGTRVLTAGTDDAVRVWAVGSGKRLHLLSGHGARVTSATFSADGTEIYSAAVDGKIRIWNAVNGELAQVLEPGLGEVSKVVCCSEGNLIAALSGEGLLSVWDRATLTERIQGTGTLMTVSRDGHLLAAADANEVFLWDLATNALLPRITAASPVNGLALSARAGLLMTLGRDGFAQIWDTSNGELRRAVDHGASLYQGAFLENGTLAITCANNNTFAVWDIATGAVVNRFSGRGRVLSAASFSEDGTRMATAAQWEGFEIWDPRYQTGRTLLDFGLTGGAGIAVSEETGMVATLNGQFGIRLATLDGTSKPVGIPLNHAIFCSRNSIVFSPDGRWITGTFDSGIPYALELDTGKTVQFRGLSGVLNAIAFDKTGARVVTACDDGTVQVWDATSSKPCLQNLGTAGPPAYDVQFSPDGAMVAVASADGTTTLWDVQSGTSVRVFKGHTAAVRSCAFAPDGRRLYTGANDRSVRVWDTETGDCLDILSGHTDSVRDVSTDPEGRYLVTSALDGVTRIWDARDYELLITLPAVGSARFMAGDAGLILLRFDGRLERWNAAAWQADAPSATDLTQRLAETNLADHAGRNGKYVPERLVREMLVPVSDRTLAAVLAAGARAVHESTGETSLVGEFGVQVRPGPLGDTLGLLGILPGDELVAFGGINIVEDARAVSLLEQSAQTPPGSLELVVARNGVKTPWRIVALPSEQRELKIAYTREEAGKLVETLATGLLNHETDIYSTRSLETALLNSGMGVGIDVYDLDLPVLRNAGIASGDRLTAIDNVPVSRYDEARSRLLGLTERVAQGAVNTCAFDIQRGEYAQMHLECVIQ